MEEKLIQDVTLKNGAIYIKGEQGREWLTRIEDKSPPFIKKLRETLESKGYTNTDNRMQVNDALEEHWEKEAKLWARENGEQDDEDDYSFKAATSAFTDYFEMADHFIAKQPLFYTKEKIWWLWNHTLKCWEMIDDVDLLNRITQSIQGIKTYQNKIKSEILNVLKQRGRLNTPKPAKDTWVQFKDKIYDISTGEIFDSTPEFHITNPIPWEVGDSEETPQMDKMFSEWVDAPHNETLYEILAYCLLPSYPINRVFCLNGEGRNGKSTYETILSRFIGKKNITSTDFDCLVNRPFEAAKLYRKLVCIMGEINSSIFKRTALFKKLTGSDLISYEFKGKDAFDEYNYAKLIVATNKLPESTDKTIGFYSRWTIIDFNNTFKENPGLLDRIPVEEYNNLAKKCLRILKERLAAGQFTGEGSIEDRMKKYEERASPIREFLAKECYENKNQDTPFYLLYKNYVAFLSQRGQRIASKREFSNLLRSREYVSKRINFRKDDGSQGSMVTVTGIGLKNSEEIDELDRQKKTEYGALDPSY